MKNPFAWGFHPRLWFREWKIERADMKRWESEQPFRFKHIRNPWPAKFDLYLGLFIALSWFLRAFTADDAGDGFSYGVVSGFIATTVLVLWRTRLHVKQLGEQLRKHHLASGEKGPDPIDQWLRGDGTVSTAVRVHPGKEPGSWRAISWMEAGTEAFVDDVVNKGSNPHRPV